MSPCLLLYGLAAVVGGTLGGPAAQLAAVLLVAAVLVRRGAPAARASRAGRWSGSPRSPG